MYKNILIKLSGESLMGDIENVSKEKTLEIAKLIKEVKALGCNIGIVIGGGNFFRGRSNKDMEPLFVDTMGMLGTTINALGLADAFKKAGVPCVISTPFDLNGLIPKLSTEEVLEKLNDNVVIFGGGTGHIGCSTDTCASNKASLINADAIIKLTNVDGVYDKDPKKYPDAVKYDTLTFTKVLNDQLNVMDMTAATMCRDNKLPILVFDMAEGNFEKAIKGETIGTLVTE